MQLENIWLLISDLESQPLRFLYGVVDTYIYTGIHLFALRMVIGHMMNTDIVRSRDPHSSLAFKPLAW